MTIARRLFRSFTGALMLYSGALLADADYSIIYHETVDSLNVAETVTSTDGPRALTLSTYAFEQSLVMELETNSEVTDSINLQSDEKNTTANSRNANFEVFRGKLRGVEGSWVRVTRSGSEFTGVFWDGEKLLAIEPFANVKEMLPDTDADDSAHVIYDTDDMLPMKGQSCAVEETAGLTYRGLVDELRQIPLSAVSGRLNIALLIDQQFVSANTGEVDTAVMTRLNVVDGIFSEQVGIRINPTEIRRIGNRLTSTSAFGLLDQLVSYGRAEVNNPGLVHLLTGRDLDGGIVGIAYLSALCSAQAGYGLSQASSGISPVRSALIVAHELGHNFGSPHDNQNGSVCAATPGTFLMNPSINGSNEFSQCSLAQMEREVARASCIVPVSPPTPEPVVLAADFDNGTWEKFNFFRDPWGFGDRRNYQSVNRVTTPDGENGALRIALGGRDSRTVRQMSGGVRRGFDLDTTSDLTVSFKVRLSQSASYESDERSEVYATFDRNFLEGNQGRVLASITGDGNGGSVQTTGLQTFRFELDQVPAGRHVLVIGGYNNKKNQENEFTEILVDDVLIEKRGNRLTLRQ